MQGIFVNGPINAARLEGDVFGIHKVIYIFMDHYIDIKEYIKDRINDTFHNLINKIRQCVSFEYMDEKNRDAILTDLYKLLDVFTVTFNLLYPDKSKNYISNNKNLFKNKKIVD